MVDANLSLGILFAMRRQYADAESSFERAVAVDPTRADIFYFWGESLRQEGKPLLASRRFRSALLRNRYETAESLYRLKYWLSEMESGEDGKDGIAEQMDTALALPRPPMEALFADAVRNLQAGRIVEGTEKLRRARQSVEPPVFAVIIRDPAFIQESWRPELAGFFPKDAPIPGTQLNEAALAPTAVPAPAAPGATEVGAAPSVSPAPTPAETPRSKAKK